MSNDFFVHPSSIVEQGATIGSGTKVWHFCHIMPNATIGANCVLGQNVYVGSAAIIGNGVHIQNNVSVYDAVVLEDDVFVGPSVVFTNVLYPRSEIDRKSEYVKTIVRKGASLGANSTIVAGIEIGEYALVGAGSVVSRSVPAYTLVMGNPARFAGYVCRCGMKMEFVDGKAVCNHCGREYALDESGIVIPK